MGLAGSVQIKKRRDKRLRPGASQYSEDWKRRCQPHEGKYYNVYCFASLRAPASILGSQSMFQKHSLKE